MTSTVGTVNIGGSSHGSDSGYSRGCRCRDCTEAHRTYSREQYAQKRRALRSPRSCALCGTSFEGLALAKYCSDPCRADARRDLMRQSSRNRPNFERKRS